MLNPDRLHNERARMMFNEARRCSDATSEVLGFRRCLALEYCAAHVHHSISSNHRLMWGLVDT